MNTQNDSIQVPHFNAPSQSMFMFNTQWPNVPPTNINFGVTNESFPVMFTGLPPRNQKILSETIVTAKRKAQEDEAIRYPQKMLITEEKMAAKMRGMHISPDYVAHDHIGKNLVSNDMADDEQNSNSDQPALYICEELQNMKNVLPVVPHSLIPVEDTSKAVVLWRPPLSLHDNNDDDEDSDISSSVVITDVTDSYIDPITGTINNPESLMRTDLDYGNETMDIV